MRDFQHDPKATSKDKRNKIVFINDVGNTKSRHFYTSNEKPLNFASVQCANETLSLNFYSPVAEISTVCGTTSFWYDFPRPIRSKKIYFWGKKCLFILNKNGKMYEWNFVLETIKLARRFFLY